ncbi:MAG: DNA polymerase I, partial [Syntrophomonadaceae bacterium]|nr:DNA polymerase I [Syntrophomonadaceae bacterium]
SETEKYTDELVMEKWEVYPERLVDVKGLMGDPSDNIPGVPGIGKKTAIKLVKSFGDLESLYERIEEVTPERIKNLLCQHRDQAFLSRSLGTIVTNLDIPLELDDFRYDNPRKSRLMELYCELEFNNFARELGSLEEEQVMVGDFREVLADVEPGDDLAVFLVSKPHHPMWAEVVETYLGWRDGVYVLAGEETPLLKPILENPLIKKYIHDSKNARIIWARKGIQLEGVVGDTLLLSYVIDPSFEGETLQQHLFHYWGRVIEQDKTPEQAVGEILNFYSFLLDKADPTILSLYHDVELPLARILGDMELNGVRVEGDTLAVISQDLGERLEMTEAAIYDLAGEDFNINSTRQLGHILFDRLGLPPIKKTKTGYSTNAAVLEQLYDHHPIIGLIMDYRQLIKLKSTYVDALPQTIHPQTGRVHTIFKQAVTATGRLSSVEPNLQNIPIRMEEGRRIRKAFTAPPGGWLLLSADYSQIDLRVLAHVTGDSTLIETFEAGIDIHARTASEIFKVPVTDVTPELRYRAKAVNFGIIYGISDFGLARDTGVSRSEAGEYIASYLDSYPGVKRYMLEIVETGRELGYVSTILGRRRYLPDLLSSNRMIRSVAERMALNTPIQGSSADIIKLAMLKIDRELKANNLQSRMILQVHDDVLLEVAGDELKQVAGIVKECMETAFKIKVPLVASVKAGLNWYEMNTWE